MAFPNIGRVCEYTSSHFYFSPYFPSPPLNCTCNKESQFYSTKLPSFLSHIVVFFCTFLKRERDHKGLCSFACSTSYPVFIFSNWATIKRTSSTFQLHARVTHFMSPWLSLWFTIRSHLLEIHYLVSTYWSPICAQGTFCPASWCLEAWPLDPFNKLLGTKHISKSNHILMIYLWSNVSVLFVALDQLWSRISRDLPSKIIM